MKLATAINSTLAAFPQKERRIALAQFITRYATDSATKITHYRCIGRDTDVITTFLTTSGFTDDDYTLVKSELDPDTCQIRWKKDSQHLHKFIESLSECLHTGVSRPEMYRCIEKGAPSRIFKDAPDPEDDTERASTSGPHLSETIQAITDKILEWAHPCTTPAQTLVWASCTSETDYQPVAEWTTNQTRAHIPQIFVLEQYVWAMDLLPSQVAKPVCPLFVPGCRNMTAARYMGLTEDVKFTAGIYDAPANLMLGPQMTAATASQNPLKGFLVDTAGQARSNKLVKPDSNAVYVLTTGVVDTEDIEETGENKLRVAEFVADSKKLWDYVTAIYESVYHGLVCTIMPHSHVGVNNNVKSLFPDSARLPVHIHSSSQSYDPFYTDDELACSNMLAICAGVVLARPEDIKCFTQSPLLRFHHQQPQPFNDQAAPVESFIQRPDDSESEYVRIAPDKNDIPAMWFAATHLEPGVVTPTRQCMVDAAAQVPEPSFQEQAAGMQRFRDLVTQWDTSELSVVKLEETPVSSMEGPCLMAFATGVAAAVRQGSPGVTDENLVTWNLTDKPGKGHSGSLYVTNVYSGVMTDKSPSLLASVHEGAKAFPHVIDTRYMIDAEFAHSTLGAIETDLFTQFVASMANGTSTAQTTMAPKSEGTHRSFILIAETNFDYSWFREVWDQSATHEKLHEWMEHAFAQAVIHRNRNYAASVSQAYQTSACPYFDRMSAAFSTATGITWSKAMTAACMSYGRTNVTIRPDSYGRTYFVFEVGVYNAMLAMAIFRFLAGMPVHTKWLARLAGSMVRNSDRLTPEEVVAPTSETLHKYIRLVIRKKLAMLGCADERIAFHNISAQNKLCTWLTAISFQASSAGVGKAYAPTRDLLTGYETNSECERPIIANFSAPCS